MNDSLLAALLVLVAYLLGAIPFGYLFAKWLKGIDVRTVGSGNYGATNVGRVLGFWYFWPVFLFDMAKGLLPTLGLPLLFEWLNGHPAAGDLRVFVAVATILGHNFPVYLNFRGGKGVATSLGAFLALDPVAGVSSALGFLTFLVVTRFVSLSSIGAALVYCLTHFAQVNEPWARSQRAMTILTGLCLVLMIVRHRKNFSRLRAGTEPKVNFRRSRKDSRKSSGPDAPYEIKADSDLARHFETAFTAAHALHGDLGLPRIEARSVAENSKDHGGYVHNKFSAVAIEVHPRSKYPAFVAIHEYGHFVDHQGLGTQGYGFASEDGGVENVMKAIMATKETKELFHSAKTFKGPAGQQVKYLADPKELFARAYSQYVATKSKHPDLLAGLESDRLGVFGKMAYWSDINFASISREFDGIFTSKK